MSSMRDGIEIDEIRISYRGQYTIVEVCLPGGKYHEVLRKHTQDPFPHTLMAEHIKRVCSAVISYPPYEPTPMPKDITVTAQSIVGKCQELAAEVGEIPPYKWHVEWPNPQVVHHMVNIDNDPQLQGVACGKHPAWRSPTQTKLLDPNRVTKYPVTCKACLATMTCIQSCVTEQQCDEPVIIPQGE